MGVDRNNNAAKATYWGENWAENRLEIIRTKTLLLLNLCSFFSTQHAVRNQSTSF